MEPVVLRGFPSTSGDDCQLNVIKLLQHASRTFPEVEVVTRRADGSIFRYNYRECYRRVQKLANALRKLGVKPGDRIGALDWNTYRYFELYFAVSGIGAVLLQVNPRISFAERTYVINHSEAELLFVCEDLIPTIEPIAEELKTVKGYVIITDKTPREVKTKLSPLYFYEEILENAEDELEWPVIDEKSAYSACYTSGTTGMPKGVYYSHRCIYLHTLMIALATEITCRDVVMQIVPMFHAQGWGLFFAAPLMGAKLVFPGRYAADQPGPLVDLLISKKVTVTAGAPAIFMPMLEYIRKLDKRPDLSGLRMLCGATEPPLAMMKGYAEYGAEVIHAYGATETTPLVLINRLKPSLAGLPDEEKWDLRRKQGLPVAGVEIKVVGKEGREVPADGQSVGELLIKGPWVTRSYYNDPRTAESFANGYWKSGDAATIDPNGYVKITDRFKDLIKSGGEWISSIDLENAIMAHPAVLEAVVVGLPHPKWEERPLALVVPREEYKNRVTKEEIIDFIRPRFAKWQLPDDVLFVNEIPKTSVGKFSKRMIREQYRDYFMKG
ncbi:long-chain fatty acid--CoA ligase [Desulfovirgula thermocuniculi]|uniref:long-chain fatty acid--CoA ligase n=1 Tax=Desulfovirgula thermocuniculi TaxID=348842 RepID=UPI00040E7FB4|nr:long-chain fatty acid--CoA ligase [Desulfovirgula thermocuniculi]